MSATAIISRTARLAAKRSAVFAERKAAVNKTFVLGRCVPSVKQNAAKICVTQLILNDKYNAYFEESVSVFAYDPEKKVKTGDIVLVREMPEKKTTLITHSIEKIVYKLGDMTDPISNKSVVADQYRDVIDEKNRLYGNVDTAFDYKKAPPRGRLEGTRDLTDKPTYTKYYDGCNDPYAW